MGEKKPINWFSSKNKILKGVIFLVGMMGAGKTSLGKTLAKQSGLPFLDTDAYIKVQTGQSIPEIFSTKGEAAFRKMEEECFYALTKSIGTHGNTLHAVVIQGSEYRHEK